MAIPRVPVNQASRDALMVTDALGNLACAYVDAVIGGADGVKDGVDPARYTAILRSQPALVRALLETAEGTPGVELPRWVLMATY